MNNSKKQDYPEFTTIKKSQENFIRGNRVYILGDFDKTISENIIPDLVELIDTMQYAKDPEIEIYINSHGGYADVLLSMLSVLTMAKSRGIKIITYNIGCAYSCASILAVIGDVRYMYRYADNLPHLGQAFLSPQTFTQLERGAKHVLDWFSMIVDIYSTHTKFSKKDLDKILKDDGYHMNSVECLKHGVCDSVI